MSDIYKENIKKLYQESWNMKWKEYEKIEYSKIFDMCSFCFDVNHRRKIQADVSGKKCGKFCYIDKRICGSFRSLLYKLGDLYDKLYTNNLPINENQEFRKLIKTIAMEIKKRGEIA